MLFPPYLLVIENDLTVSTVPTVTTIFGRDDIYANRSDPAAAEAWAALMPVGSPEHLEQNELD